MSWLLAVPAKLVVATPLFKLPLGAMFASPAPWHIRTTRAAAMPSSRVVPLSA
jgi:hypothetical protein